MYSFPNLEPIHCSMSSSNFCFLTWIQVSQEAGKEVWYSQLFNNFPQFVVIHTKSLAYTIMQKQIYLFWNFFAFSMMLAIWSLIPLPFLNPACISGSSWFRYCQSLAWWILNITLLACEMSAIVWYFEHSLPLPFFGIGTKTDLFQSCGQGWVLQICWHVELQHFNSIIF